MRVFVTGGTGLIGTRLVRQLANRGDQVLALTRRPAAVKGRFAENVSLVEGDPTRSGPWMDAVADCDGVIHLAGENVFAKRWSTEFKELLRSSRVESTRNIVQAITRQPRSPSGQAKVLVNASAIGYYGPHGDEELDETCSPGDDLLARVCVEWEKEARAAEGSGVRVAMIRIGVVFDKEGGALAKMLTPFKLGLGGPVGSGKQLVSWIHHADMTGVLLLALDNAAATGPINATAPQPVTSRDFGKALGRALHRPAFMPTPAFGLRVMLGEVSQLLTTGQRVVPKRAMQLGYGFRFPNLDAALADILAG
jgi:uncharacterized protein (TIGR01777 family)